MTSSDVRDAAAQLDDLLTAYQLRILALARGGHSVVQIAGVLGRSTGTVQYHRAQIRARLGGVDWPVAELIHHEAGLPAEARNA